MRRLFALPSLLCLVHLFLGVNPTAAQQRNVVVYITDDQGTAVGCYGDPDARTPALDALAADGVRFVNAYCTTASCSPSRAALLSGQHGHSNGMYGLQHAKHHFESFGKVRSLSTRLSKAGYVTARVGKYHVAPHENYPFDHALRGGSPVGMAEHVRRFLEERDEERPFFLFFGTHEPHRSGGVAEDQAGTPNLFGNRDREDVVRERFDPKALTLPDWLPKSVEARAEWAQFHESSNRADQGFGRLCQVLRESGVWDETLVIFLSDHGPPFPGAKTTVYEPGLRVPFVVRDPFEEERGRSVETLVSLLDVAPTILSWCGVDDTEGLQGRDLQPWLAGEAPKDWVDEIYASHTFHEVTMYYPMRVVRTPRYKLIWNLAHGLPFPFASDLWNASTWQAARHGERYGRRSVEAYLHRPRFELYDLEEDPYEVRNLAADPDHQTRLELLKGKLRDFQRSTKDPWRLKWDRE